MRRLLQSALAQKRIAFGAALIVTALPSGGFGEIAAMPVVLAHVAGPSGLRRAYSLPIVPMPDPPGRDRQPATDNRQPTTDSRGPMTENRSATTDDRLFSSSHLGERPAVSSVERGPRGVGVGSTGESVARESTVCGERVQVRAIVIGDDDAFAVLAIDGESRLVRGGATVGSFQVTAIREGHVALRNGSHEVRCELQQR